ncbi:MAG: hypothetical protein V4692_02750, partial [Bdellovibrionota bacterium]
AISERAYEDAPIGKTASQVACRIYDPWAANHVRFKKLLLDTASAVATATLQIPLYLDLKPSTPKVASFTQLVEDDTIKLDPVFYKQGWKKTMFADLSGFAKAPCTISVSENAQILPGDRTLLYKGISAAVCTSKSETVSDQDSASVSRGESKRQSVCGSCSINFATVSTAFVRRGFGTLGAGLKMVTAVAQFFQAGNDPSAKAKTKTINVAHVVAAYQRYGLIPDRCVKDLAKGKVCEEKREPTRVTKRTSK